MSIRKTEINNDKKTSTCVSARYCKANWMRLAPYVFRTATSRTRPEELAIFKLTKLTTDIRISASAAAK